ncbi:hypothetical protein LUZ61_004994 [Rhynchospora tenuis]|uniref:SKP1 component POZ domain-containing protein n=1 Tax=Rhynchospora tenuis TaxID=198213 RepID=A0AAD6EU99_9POAL|nr:hypothetical protein LUZ61_004991 [Rhynchospora tenuis]KAJ3701289.1 hypothetical protein LUZ61_004994 [Rhynchospora tenuis]
MGNIITSKKITLESIITSKKVTLESSDGEENNTTSKKITLESSDGVKIEVPEAMAKVSRTIQDMFKEDYDKGLIFVPKVTGKTLAMVIEYCKKHAKVKYASKEDLEELRNWDREFVDHDVLAPTLYELTYAAHFLKIKELMDLVCRKRCDLKQGRSPDEIRRSLYFGNELLSLGED